MNTVPINKEESAAWLHNFYMEKDELKKTFLRTGNFIADCSFVQPSRHYIGLLLLIASNTLVLVPLLYALVTGGWMMKLMVVFLVGIAMIAMKIIGDTTKIEKSSKYGVNNNQNFVKRE